MTKKEKESVTVLCHKVAGIMNRLSDEERETIAESMRLVQGEAEDELDKKYSDVPEIKKHNGCVYCHDFFNEGENRKLIEDRLYLNGMPIADAYVEIALNRLKFSISGGVTAKIIKIEFCPMCGKKLEYADRVKIENARFDLNDPTFIDYLGLSIRSHNSLKRAGILSINDFCNLTADSLKKVRNLGRHSYVEIANALKENGVIISDILLEAAKI